MKKLLILSLFAFGSYVNCSENKYDCFQWTLDQFTKSQTDEHTCKNYANDCGNFESCMTYYEGKDKDQACHCTYPKSTSLLQLIALFN
jgi:hypothetical protein